MKPVAGLRETTEPMLGALGKCADPLEKLDFLSNLVAEADGTT